MAFIYGLNPNGRPSSKDVYCCWGIPPSSMDEDRSTENEHYCAHIKIKSVRGLALPVDYSYRNPNVPGAGTDYLYHPFGCIRILYKDDKPYKYEYVSTMPPRDPNHGTYNPSWIISTEYDPTSGAEALFERLIGLGHKWATMTTQEIRALMLQYLPDASISYPYTSQPVQPLNGLSDLGSKGFASAMCAAALNDCAEVLDQRVAAAFLECCGQLKLSGNNIANALDTIDLLKSIKRPTKILETIANKLKKLDGEAAKDAWLKYRYVYNTTKADLEDLQSKIDQVDFNPKETWIARTSFAEPVETHCKLVAVEDLSGFDGAKDIIPMVLKKLGLYPTPYLLWDLVPFSFVADWVLPIGEKLEKYDLIDWAQSMPYETTFVVSHKGTHTFQGIEYEFYLRHLVDISDLDFATESDGYKPSVKTWAKRGADIWALRK